MTQMVDRIASPSFTAALSPREQTMVRMFRRGKGKSLTPEELDEAWAYCQMTGANPLSSDIYFWVFHPDDPKKRNMVPVLSIGLYRKIAERTGRYRPDMVPPRFTYDETQKGPHNPKGLVDCEVTIYKYAQGEWFPVCDRLTWASRAPIEYETSWLDTGETWKDSGKPKKKRVVDYTQPLGLESGKERWAFDGEGMLAKCVEAHLIRKAFGDARGIAGTFVDGDVDRTGDVLDLAPSEFVELDEQKKLQAKTGGIIVDWCDGEPLCVVPEGQFADQVLAWANEMVHLDDVSRVELWHRRNIAARRQFFATNKSDALELNRKIEAIISAGGQS